MSPYYGNLCTEFYDLTKPWALTDELAFYQQFLSHTKEPILEAMCGTGRLLLPLLEAGFNVNGIDSSHDMLSKCRDKAKIKNLKPVLYEADIADIQLDKQYHTIIIAVGSFQLIYPREVALRVLQNLKSHLVPGGTLLLDTFIPWEALCAEEENSAKEAKTADDDLIKISIHEKANKIEQYIDSTLCYEKIREDKVIQSETELMKVCWYYKYEFKLFLEQAGFHSVTLHTTTFSMNPNGIFYAAIN